MYVVSHLPSTSFFVSCFVFTSFLSLISLFLFFSVSSSSGLKALVVVGTCLSVFALFIVLQSNTKCAWFEAAAALRKRFSHLWDVMCRWLIVIYRRSIQRTVPVSCPGKSVTTNQGCITSHKNKNLKHKIEGQWPRQWPGCSIAKTTHKLILKFGAGFLHYVLEWI